jgi:aryl sulfotransferase
MGDGPVRYVSPDDDSGRWDGFEFREGDIVISTRSKSGTTWVQMICALLVFQTDELPAPLTRISPWLDWSVASRDRVVALLDGQEHRRVIKTHTPLDGIPIDDRATYVVVARHPLDMAVSLYHHGDNLDRDRIRELIGDGGPSLGEDRPPLLEWLLAWIDWRGDPQDQLDSLPGVMWHLGDAWARRDRSNVVLVRYEDLSDDLDGEMRRLAERLGFQVDESRWPDLVDAAGFERMRDRADLLAPGPDGILKDRARFFRRGSSGAGQELLTPAQLDHYDERARELAPLDLLAWLHRDPMDP